MAPRPHHLSLALVALVASACGEPPPEPAPPPTQAPRVETPPPPEPTVLPRRFVTARPWEVALGQGEQAIGFEPARPEDLPRGPCCFVVGSEGRVVVLDNVQERLLVLGAEGGVERAVPLRNARAMRELTALPQGRFGAFDPQHNEVVTFSPEGGLLSRFEVDPRRIAVEELRAAEGGALAIVSAGRHFVVADPTNRSRAFLALATATVSRAGVPAAGAQLRAVVRRGQGARLEVSQEGRAPRQVELPRPVRGELASATWLATDSQGRHFVRLEVITDARPRPVRRFVTVMSPQLEVLDTFEATPPEGALLDWRDLQVGPDGVVYAMTLLPSEGRARLTRWLPPERGPAAPPPTP